jgi:hypothetical protein
VIRTAVAGDLNGGTRRNDMASNLNGWAIWRWEALDTVGHGRLKAESLVTVQKCVNVVRQ